jgi:hypothetical protein
MYLRLRGEKPSSVGELGLQVGRDAVDDLRAPALGILPCADLAANLPVEADEFLVNGPSSALSRRVDTGL